MKQRTFIMGEDFVPFINVELSEVDNTDDTEAFVRDHTLYIPFDNFLAMKVGKEIKVYEIGHKVLSFQAPGEIWYDTLQKLIEVMSDTAYKLTNIYTEENLNILKIVFRITK